MKLYAAAEHLAVLRAWGGPALRSWCTETSSTSGCREAPSTLRAQVCRPLAGEKGVHCI